MYKKSRLFSYNMSLEADNVALLANFTSEMSIVFFHYYHVLFVANKINKSFHFHSKGSNTNNASNNNIFSSFGIHHTLRSLWSFLP